MNPTSSEERGVRSEKTDLLAEAAKIVALPNGGRWAALTQNIEHVLRLGISSDTKLCEHALVDAHPNKPVLSPLDLGADSGSHTVTLHPPGSGRGVEYTYEEVAAILGVGVREVAHLFQPATAVSAQQSGKDGAL